MRTEASFSRCARLVLNSLLLTSDFFCVCLHVMLHVLRSPLIVSENIAFFFAMMVTEGTPVRPRTRIYCLCPANGKTRGSDDCEN